MYISFNFFKFSEIYGIIAFDEGERFLISWLAEGLRVFWAIVACDTS